MKITKLWRHALLGAALFACWAAAVHAGPQEVASEFEERFAHPPDESRMATYWWVFGPAWTKPEISRELRVLKDAGIGRILIFPLYPYEVDDPERGIKNQEYLSPEFLDHFQYAVRQANELGLAVDLVMGTGWPYGGPTIPQELSPRRMYSKTVPFDAAPGTEISVKLPELGEHDELIAVQLVGARRAR